jgi:hypothetical protein
MGRKRARGYHKQTLSSQQANGIPWRTGLASGNYVFPQRLDFACRIETIA